MSTMLSLRNLALISDGKEFSPELSRSPSMIIDDFVKIKN